MTLEIAMFGAAFENPLFAERIGDMIL